jgi:tripartite-type tricarboxylate transporter receptor subunit TctC
MAKPMVVPICGLLAFFSILLVPAPVPTQAAEYPERTITLLVPYAPGAVTDLGARALAEAMEKNLKKAVVVVNRPGGGTTIAGNTVANAKPDGYTLGYFPSSASLPEVYTYFYQAPYSSKELRPVCRVVAPVLTVAVKGDSPVNSLKDFAEYARKNPGTKIGTNGKSTTGYLAIRAIAKAENLSLVDVPFEGGARILAAILGGHVPIGVPSYPEVKSLADAKQMKILAFLIERRADFAPNVPTMVELGYRLAAPSFNGVFAPKGTPDAVVARLNDAVTRITQDAVFQTKINNIGMQVFFEDTKSFERSLEQQKKNLQQFFKDEGLVK